LLAQHQNTPSQGHYNAALYVAKYLATTRTLGIYITSTRLPILELFLHFPVNPPLLSMSDANWGPQDASQLKKSQDLPLFASHSMSAFYIDLLAHYIGCLRDKLLPLAVPPKLRFTQRMNASSFF
jgi:hypothetical protein